MNAATHTRRGFAVVIVIVAIGMLAVILAAVAGRVSNELRRGRIDAADTQASQLLAAAAHAAEAQAGEGARKDGPVATPVGRVMLAWDGTAACVAEVTCYGATRHARLVFDGVRLTRVE